MLDTKIKVDLLNILIIDIIINIINYSQLMATIPEEYLCPITKEIMTEPVTDEYGHTYEKKALQEWLRFNNKSPLTNTKYKKTKDDNLYINVSLRAIIKSYIESSEQNIQTIIDTIEKQYDGINKTSLTELEQHFDSLNNYKYSNPVNSYIAKVLKHLFLYVDLEQCMKYEIKCVDNQLTNIEQIEPNTLLSFIQNAFQKFKLTDEQIIDIVISLLCYEYQIYDTLFDLNTIGIITIAKQSFYDTLDKSKIKSPMLVIKFNTLYDCISNIDLEGKRYSSYGKWRSESKWINKELVNEHQDDNQQLKIKKFIAQRLTLVEGRKHKSIHESRYKFKYIIDGEEHSIKDWIIYKGITIDVDSFTIFERYLAELLIK